MCLNGQSHYKKIKMMADVYSHIIDDDRRLNAQRFEEQFYQTKAAPADCETQEEKASETAQSDQEILLKRLANPEIVELLKSLAKNLYPKRAVKIDCPFPLQNYMVKNLSHGIMDLSRKNA